MIVKLDSNNNCWLKIKPALVLTIGLLMLTLFMDNHAMFYYGQLLPHPSLLNMVLDVIILIALFLGAQKLEAWLK
jgi:hypothetical protein